MAEPYFERIVNFENSVDSSLQHSTESFTLLLRLGNRRIVSTANYKRIINGTNRR